jgi:hypothetical protein
MGGRDFTSEGRGSAQKCTILWLQGIFERLPYELVHVNFLHIPKTRCIIMNFFTMQSIPAGTRLRIGSNIRIR